MTNEQQEILIGELWEKDNSTHGGRGINPSAYRIGALAMYRHLNSKPSGLRWVKASERLPKYAGSPQIHYRIDGFHKVNGNFHYSIDDERCEGEIVFTVIGGHAHADYQIPKEKWSGLEWLEEFASTPTLLEEKTEKGRYWTNAQLEVYAKLVIDTYELNKSDKLEYSAVEDLSGQAGHIHVQLPAVEEAKTETGIAPILKLSEWLNQELVCQESHVKSSKREFHKGALAAYEAVAVEILRLTSTPPSAPTVESGKPVNGHETAFRAQMEIVGGYIGKIDIDHWTLEQVRESLSKDWEYLQKHAPSTIEPAAETEKQIPESFYHWVDNWIYSTIGSGKGKEFDEKKRLAEKIAVAAAHYLLSHPSPLSIQQEAEKKYSRSELFEICGGWSENLLHAAQGRYFPILDMSNMFNDWFDKNYPYPTQTAQQEAIPEDFRKWAKAYADGNSIDAPPTVAEWLNPELFQAALNTYRHLNPLSSPPSVKTEREEDERPECYDGFCQARKGSSRITLCMHCGGELIQVENAWYHYSSFDSEGNLIEGAQIQDFISQPSPIVREGESQDSRFDSEKFWELHKRTFTGVNGGEYIDKEDFCISVSRLETNSVTIATDWHKEMHRADSLQSQLYNTQQEIKQLRGFLLETVVRMGLDLPCHEDLVDLFNIGMSGRSDLYCAISEVLYNKLEQPPRLEPKEFILFNPIPQTPTNE